MKRDEQIRRAITDHKGSAITLSEDTYEYRQHSRTNPEIDPRIITLGTIHTILLPRGQRDRMMKNMLI
jgi:hypothetical protein